MSDNTSEEKKGKVGALVSNLTGLSDLFQGFVTFVKQNRSDVLTSLGVIFLGFMMYAYFNYQQTQIQFLQDAIINHSEEPEVSDTLSRQLAINQKLENFVLTVGADRAKVFQFNNGKQSTTGIPYLFSSATHEGVRPGISSEINRLQDIPSSLFSRPAEFVEDPNPDDNIPVTEIDDYKAGYVRCKDADNAGSQVASDLLKAQDVTHSCSYGIFKNGKISGILTVNWVTSEFYGCTEELEFQIKKMSQEVSTLLYTSQN